MKKKKTRRPNGDGSLYQLKDGRWGAAIYYTNEDGERERKTFTNKSKEIVVQRAQNWLEEHSADYNDNVFEQDINANTSIEDFIKAFKIKLLVPSIRVKEITSRTYLNYDIALQRFIDYCNGKGDKDKDNKDKSQEKLTLGSCDVVQLRKFFKYLVNKKNETNGNYVYGQESVRITKIILKKAFRWAVDREYIHENPITFKCPTSKKVTERVKGLQGKELLDLLNVMTHNKILYPAIHLMVHTGMRTQEVLALAWKNIDMEKKSVHIEHALTKEYDIDSQGEKHGKSKTVLSDTKTSKSNRVVFVDEETVEILKQWKEYAKANTKTQFGGDDYVFGNTQHSHWTYAGFRTSVNKFLKNSDYAKDKIRLHSLRHTVATLLALNGAGLLDIMAQLGHSKTKMALRYIDEAKEFNEKNRDKISSALKELGEKAG